MSDLVARTTIDRRIAEIIQGVMADMGYVLVRVRFMAGAKHATLQIMAEREDGSINVEGLEEVSRTISALIDVEDPIERQYDLEVSSPGIDRPLTLPIHFDRYAGWEAKLETHDLIEGRRRFKGVLQGFEDGEVLIEIAEGIIGLKFEWLAEAKLVLNDEIIRQSLKAKKDAGQIDGAEAEEVERALSAAKEDDDGLGQQA